MQLKVMSFNIRFDNPGEEPGNRWGARREMVFDLLREEAADVVGLQESLRSQLDDLRANLPQYGEIGVGRDDGKAGGEHCNLLYRADRFQVEDRGTFWFSDTPAVPGSRSWGNSITRICSWARLVEAVSGQRFAVYNAHLDHQSQPSRERSIELMLERMKQQGPEVPLIAMGDFNVQEDNVILARMRAEDSPAPVEAFRAANPETPDAGTFHGFAGGPGVRLDYIFLSPHWRVLGSRIIRTARCGRYPSDHYPLVATIEV